MTRAYANRVSRARSGDLAFDALIDNPGGLTIADLAELTSLTRGQVRYALGYIRDVLASDKGEPITYDPHTRLYKLAPVPEDAASYTAYRLRVSIVQLRRLRSGSIEPAIQKFPKARWMQGVALSVDMLDRALVFAYDEVAQHGDGRLPSGIISGAQG